MILMLAFIGYAAGIGLAMNDVLESHRSAPGFIVVVITFIGTGVVWWNEAKERNDQ